MRQRGAEERGKVLTTRPLLPLPSPISLKKLNRTQTKAGASQLLATPGKSSSPAQRHASRLRGGGIGARRPSMVCDNSAGRGTRALAPHRCGFKQSVPDGDVPRVTYARVFLEAPPPSAGLGKGKPNARHCRRREQKRSSAPCLPPSPLSGASVARASWKAVSIFGSGGDHSFSQILFIIKKLRGVGGEVNVTQFRPPPSLRPSRSPYSFWPEAAHPEATG